jgi:hypothetical protein
MLGSFPEEPMMSLPDASQAPPAVPRSRNWDAYTAGVATLIGLLALLVSGYTAYVQRQQLRAQVWPHLTIATNNVPPEIGLHVINSGTGPARIVAVRVTVDHHPAVRWEDAQKAMGVNPEGIIQSQLSNTVLPAGKDMTILRPFDEATTPRFVADFLGSKHDLTIAVYYCSVLDECWLVTTEDQPAALGGPAACPIAVTERFKQ